MVHGAHLPRLRVLSNWARLMERGGGDDRE